MFDRQLLFTAFVAGMAGSVGLGCGGDEPANGGDNGSVALSAALSASATSVRSGDTVELTWTVNGATSVILRQGDTELQNLTGDDAVSGSRTSNAITDDTTFTLIAENADERLERTLDVTVQGIRIAEFTASPSTGIRSGDVVELSWLIEGANVENLELTDEDGNVPVDADGNEVDLLIGEVGSVEVLVLGDLGAETDTETFTLRAVGGGGEVTASVELDVEVALPIIDEFTTTQADGSTTYIVGESIEVSWTVRNATRVIIRLDNGDQQVTCADNSNFDNNVQNRTSCRNNPAQEGPQTVTILVGNANTPDEADYVTRDLTVTGVQPPAIESFTVSPDTYWQGLTEVTFTWDTSNAARVELQQFVSLGGGQDEYCTIKETPDPGCRGFDVTAPTSADGTFTFQVEGTQPRSFRLRAILADAQDNEVTAVNQQVSVTPDFDEPSSSFENPILIAEDNFGLSQRATITNPGEEDWFAVDVPENGRIVARAGVNEFDIGNGRASCLEDPQLADTEIEMFDESRTSLGIVGSNAFDAFQQMADTSCAVITGHRHPFALDLPAGRYFFKVVGEDNRVGEYTFAVDVYEPIPEPFTEIEPVNGPQWEITDINVVAIPLDNPGFAATLLWGFSNQSIIANNGGAFFRQSSVLVGGAPHSEGWESELQAAWQVAGLKVNSGFDTRDIAAGIAMNDPAFALALSYTVVPTGATSTTTFDYRPLGTAVGPALPVDIFPFTTDVQRFGKSFGDVVFDENLNPMNGDPVDPLAYPVFPEFDCTPVPNSPNPAPGCSAVVQGVSHRHFFHVNSALFQSTGPIMNPADRYTWTVHIFDATDAGYEVEVSFDIAAAP